MNRRKTPFGYQWADGTVLIYTEEAQIVERIFGEYETGASLQLIAERLTEAQTEYLPGVYQWDKSRVKRILDDARYCGIGFYPTIIEQARYAEIQCRKSIQCTQEHAGKPFQFDVPVLCGVCRTEMYRRHDGRYRRSERWICMNPECDCRVPIQDEVLLERIQIHLRRMASNPTMIQAAPKRPLIQTSEEKKLRNEVAHMCDRLQVEEHAVAEKWLEILVCQYQAIPDDVYIHQKILAALAEEDTPERIPHIVQSITLSDDGSVRLTLRNGQEIGGEFHRNES